MKRVSFALPDAQPPLPGAPGGDGAEPRVTTVCNPRLLE